MSIATEQNTPANLCLLAAQRRLYTEAKWMHYGRILVGVIVALLGPVVLFRWPDLKGALVLLVAVSAGAYAAAHFERRWVKQAATIQEQFDIGLFGLAWNEWNEFRVRPMVPPELIHAASKRYRGSQEEIRDWYIIPECPTTPMVVLLCQRQNLIWDYRLQHYLGFAILVLVALWGVILLAICSRLQLSFNEALLALILPSLPGLVQTGNLATEHLGLASTKESLANKLYGTWEKGLKDPASVTFDMCRSVQDLMFDFRSKLALVPDRLHKWLREQFQDETQLTTQEMLDQMKGLLGRPV